VLEHELTPEQLRILRQERAAFLEARLDQLRGVMRNVRGDLLSSQELPQAYDKLMHFIDQAEKVCERAENGQGDITFLDVFLIRLGNVIDMVDSLDFSELPFEREQSIRAILELIEVH